MVRFGALGGADDTGGPRDIAIDGRRAEKRKLPLLEFWLRLVSGLRDSDFVVAVAVCPVDARASLSLSC